MMHADLIDQDDLISQLRAIGLDVPSGLGAEHGHAYTQSLYAWRS